MSMYPKISDDKKAEENNKKCFFLFFLNYLTLLYDGDQQIVVDIFYQCRRLISIIFV